MRPAGRCGSAGLWPAWESSLGEQPVEVVENLGRDLGQRLGEESLGQLSHEPPVSVERRRGPADVLDVIEPRLEQLGDRALLGLDDAAVDLGDENGKGARGLALRPPEGAGPVLPLAGDRVCAFETRSSQ